MVTLDLETKELVITHRIPISALGSLQDTVHEALDKSLTQEELIALMNQKAFPLADVIKWGMSDTEVQEDIYLRLKDGAMVKSGSLTV